MLDLPKEIPQRNISQKRFLVKSIRCREAAEDTVYCAAFYKILKK